jgi:hypothetical protein
MAFDWLRLCCLRGVFWDQVIEHYPDAHRNPGIGNLVKKLPSKCATLIAIAHDHFINQRVVAFVDVVNANLRIFSDFRGFDHSPI